MSDNKYNNPEASKIIYLDQNKWIELSRLAHGISKAPLLSKVMDLKRRNKILIPLSATNIYETTKIRNPERRRQLALTQATLSGGIVIRSRLELLRAQIRDFVFRSLLIPLPKHEPNWFLSNFFQDAFSTETTPEAETLRNMIEKSIIAPSHLLYAHLENLPEQDRQHSVSLWTNQSKELLKRIEERRSQDLSLSRELRKRKYSLMLAVDYIGTVLEISSKREGGWKKVSDIGERLRDFVEETPSLFLEREIALRIEEQVKQITENDLRDMISFSTIIPYADIVIGEKNFVNLCRQSGVTRKFDCEIHTDVNALARFD